AENLVFTFTRKITHLLSQSVVPVLQRPIGVGSAFEGWSPFEEDSAFCFLMPLKAPHGHTFHVEPGTAEETPARNFCIRVGLLCTCTAEQQLEKTVCFVHHSEEELRGNMVPGLLQSLCTGSYLDVEKTACWFHQKVKEVWKALPQSSQRTLTVLPSSRSCRYQVTRDRQRSLTIEVIFGVRRGDSDIFLSSQASEGTFIPSTTWSESYAVAELKLFRHMAGQGPNNPVHLRCLRTCARILNSTSFSTYTFKTVVVHLLTTIPQRSDSRRFYPQHLQAIMRYLWCSLKKKHLNHFFFGNKNVPKEIVLPPDFQSAEPVNLFQHLAHNPDAHARAWGDFNLL
ncbi:IPIL1 protein, partial [Centropus unirufus]|nr:IPIL1 protein [Centropus unirufus]